MSSVFNPREHNKILIDIALLCGDGRFWENILIRRLVAWEKWEQRYLLSNMNMLRMLSVCLNETG